MVSASDTGHLVFVEELLDEALGLDVELHEDDVSGVDPQLEGRLPPRDVLVEEELERKMRNSVRRFLFCWELARVFFGTKITKKET